MNESQARLKQLSPLKRALYELKEMRAKFEKLKESRNEPIAVIGMGCRFPGGANSPEEFWQLLKEGMDAISEVPPERWNVEGYYDPDIYAPGKMSTRWSGLMAEVDKFDASFFHISRREAVNMDPQQRILLEVSLEALENAGQAPDQLINSATGVFVGIGTSDYWFKIMKSGDPKTIDGYLATGGSHSVASGRVSYILGLQGPSVSVDTACSSSLFTIHLATKSLRNRECDLALAGGVNVLLCPELTISLSKARLMAKDGRCKTFDHRADGFVRSEGCGMVVLKRLSDALSNGDRILALIRGSASNQDGRSSSLTAPSGPSQEKVIRSALKDAGVKPRKVSFIETHGTGTELGDPIEVGALDSVFASKQSKDHPLILGAVKTNIGHLEAAAGVAGFIKAVLCLMNKEIPPNLHFESLNPNIRIQNTSIVIPKETLKWQAVSGSRIAGVSSFGFSGTNAHVILEEAPPVEVKKAGVERPLHLLSLSAKTDKALKELARLHGRHLAAHPSLPLADVCFTANAGRTHFNHRFAAVAQSLRQVQEQLGAFAAGKSPAGVLSGKLEGIDRPEIAFLFSGQGAQYVGMGRELYKTQPTFRKALDRCDELLRPYLEKPLLSVLYAEPWETSSTSSRQASPLEETAYTQPALFALEYSLWALWRSWGIEPSVVMGHGVGEYVAACVVEVFSLEDGLKLIAERARLMQTLPAENKMAAVFADQDRVTELIAPYAETVSIAAVNGPENTVITGEGESVRRVLKELAAEGIKAQGLKVSHAFHSPLMELIIDEFNRIVSTVAFNIPSIEIISNLTGKVAIEEMTEPEYWCRHLREPVQFAQGMETLHNLGCQLFLEIGPNPVLLGMGRLCLPNLNCCWLPSLEKNVDQWRMMLESLGQLYVLGGKVDWKGVDQNYPRRLLQLPTYPFQRKRYWFEEKEGSLHKDSSVSGSIWESVVTAGQIQSQQCPLELTINSYPKKWQCLHSLTIAHLVHTLQHFDLFSRPGERLSIDAIRQKTGINPNFSDLLTQWLKRLTEEDLLQKEDEDFVLHQNLPEIDLNFIWQETREMLADLPILLEYMENCGRKLIPVLKGEENPLNTIFPSGSFKIAEYIYQDWPLIRYFTNIVRNVLVSIVNQKVFRKPLRVIEIGAGIGGTTTPLLSVLASNESIYWFTDLSDLFLARGREKYKDYQFVNYGLLDIEESPQSQGYGEHCFDVVVAANVLHATHDLNNTLGYVKSLLAPGGFLLLFEVTEHPSWFAMCFDLLEGLHLYKDQWRKDHPFLSVEKWKEALRFNGFQKVVSYPEKGSKAETLIHHVFVARIPQKDWSQPEQLSYDVKALKVSRSDRSNSQDLAESKGPLFLEPQEFLKRLEQVLPEQRLDLLIDYVREHLMGVLRTDLDSPPDQRSRLMDLGVDSLAALEFVRRLERGLDLSRSLPATLIFDYPTIEAISRYLMENVFKFEKLPTKRFEKESVPKRGDRMSAEELENLSGTEVEALILAKLKNMEKNGYER